jgi:helix-turn-helix protein
MLMLDTNTLDAPVQVPDILTTQDVAKYLQVCLPVAYRIMRSPGFPLLRWRRVLRVPRGALVTWLEQQAGVRSDA